MPANLPPAYKEAEDRFRAAVTPEEKIAALEEMLSVMPKHKGTEKLQADLKSRIAKLKRAPKKKPGSRGPSHKIPREGAGQIALVGPPNSGKSTLVAARTHADPEVAPYPFTTREATPGMMHHQDVAYQLVDLPPLSDEYVEGWVYDLIRGADLVWLVLDVERAMEGLEMVEPLLADKAIVLVPAQPAAAAGSPDAPDAPDETRPVDERRPGWAYKETVLVLTGIDRPDAREDLPLLEDLLEIPYPRTAVSAVTGEGIEELGALTFDALGIMRVYTKEPGDEPDLEQPFTLPVGATVEDLARTIHREIAEDLKFARVWGPSVHDGQRVQGGHVLEEGDVVELHV
jgi:ribosome-interacting GTPase 1